jgi:hypothetical protein
VTSRPLAFFLEHALELGQYNPSLGTQQQGELGTRVYHSQDFFTLFNLVR